MANPEHLALIVQGVDVWNAWRAEKPSVTPELCRANLRNANLSGANFSGADLEEADLEEADMSGAALDRANLRRAGLDGANLSGADLRGASLVDANLTADLRNANLRGADLSDADAGAVLLSGADLEGANLSRARLHGASLGGANLSGARLRSAEVSGAGLRGANLSGADLRDADFGRSDLHRANLSHANLTGADLEKADLSGADLRGARLNGAQMLETNLEDANLINCRIYGISAWNVKLNERTNQEGLIMTNFGEPEVTVDDLEVAQFVYLLLHNEKIRRVIDTVGKKGVLLLGRFTEGRIVVLERLQEELRKRGYLPIVFNFDKPETKDFTETVRLLAGLSKFVIADLTSPKSAPYELAAIVSQTMIPFQPIIAEGETPFAMMQDLWINYPDRVFRPIHYSSVDALIASLDEKIIKPAEARFVELLKRKADTMGGEHV